MLQRTFATYGIPDELPTDGGPEFVTHITRSFLSDWGVHYRLSSVAFPHSSWRAVVEVKKIKQIITNNVRTGGNLNVDKFQKRFYNTAIHQPDGRRSILDDLKYL